MVREAAPTKATSGVGYTYADKVAAAFLVQMLLRTFPVEPESGSQRSCTSKPVTLERSAMIGDDLETRECAPPCSFPRLALLAYAADRAEEAPVPCAVPEDKATSETLGLGAASDIQGPARLHLF
jgi:hypothetical protein